MAKRAFDKIMAGIESMGEILRSAQAPEPDKAAGADAHDRAIAIGRAFAERYRRTMAALAK